MRLSVFLPESSQQLFIDLQKLYQGSLSEQQLTPDALQKLITTPDTLFFVTLFNARHLGAVQVTIEQENAQLNLLCVRDLTRRRGVGRNLLREVEKQLQAKNISQIQLPLTALKEHERETMTLFMQACGYQVTGEMLTKSL
ncbi:aspartate 1-decarboxylase autocleavage activator PanM [Psychromonas sp. Urea-02u-13]|uniref:aspartate 1-decarboxylase autocleavage activator PanM n=1 Tax=Psychromonas sp. Urea-02u-13 TaxID=2058326 RepID=UPI000C34DE7C|nr:aspartate 1-decarboxylase autocleavage activator PanM [Psychromonas sp. Urea-02u-13]PKG37953.1 aspartate 1-decarboxylase autocleavage activator PanM [Psychromonas sp. Urea-02u-13]